MEEFERIRKLRVPTGRIDAVLDTDAYNEIDDQYAIAYMLRSTEKINCRALFAAPFYNTRTAVKKSSDPADGMKKSYAEIQRIAALASDTVPPIYHGAEQYLPDEKTPAASEAAEKLIELAMQHSKEDPLYVVGIACATNIASAILMQPQIIERIVVVWLGGQRQDYDGLAEFNMRQDVAAARVLFLSGVPLVQLPCRGVVDHFSTTRYELEHWLVGKNALCDYLARTTVAHCEALAPGKPWSKPIWDVTAVAWLLNDEERFMLQKLQTAPVPEYDHRYAHCGRNHTMLCVYHINRDVLFADLFEKLAR